MPTKNLIVAAANKYRVTSPDGTDVREITLVDCGHMCNNMYQTVKILKDFGCKVELMKELPDRGQGFIDESGNYYNRSEAYKIAKSSGQPFNNEYTLGKYDEHPRLDSSCIRHFDGSKSLKDYMN